MDYSDQQNHIYLFDALLGVDQSKNRETRFDYNLGRDTRPDSLRPGRAFYQIRITTRNLKYNPVEFSWFYHSNNEAEYWYMTSLSFRGMGLNFIDFSILDKLENLEYLDLQGNSLKKFVDDTFHPKEFLHTLNLSSNSLNEFDIDYASIFPNLRYLSLHDNEIHSFDLSILQKLPSINRVILSSNSLTKMKLSTLNQLPYLHVLDLSSNNIDRINCELDLPKLTSLELHNNKIKEFRLRGQLENLKYLTLFENLIECIDLELLSLTAPNLSKLHIWGNLLKTLDFHNTSFPEITELLLSGNALISVILNDELTNLRILDVSYNSIEKINIPSDLNNLEIIDLSFNPISQIDLNQLPSSLKLIRLTGTKLSSIKLPLKHKFTVHDDENQATKIITNSILKMEIPKDCILKDS